MLWHVNGGWMLRSNATTPTFGIWDTTQNRKLCFQTANSFETTTSLLRQVLFRSTHLNQAMAPLSLTWGFYRWPSYQPYTWLTELVQNQLSWNFARSGNLTTPFNATIFLTACKSPVKLSTSFSLKSRISPFHANFFHLFLPHTLTPFFSGEPSLHTIKRGSLCWRWNCRTTQSPSLSIFNHFWKFILLHREVNHSRLQSALRYGWSWINQPMLISEDSSGSNIFQEHVMQILQWKSRGPRSRNQYTFKWWKAIHAFHHSQSPLSMIVTTFAAWNNPMHDFNVGGQ